MKINLCCHCGKKFKPRTGKRYCSDKCRFEAWKVTAAPCFYCGCPAASIDHVPPRSVRPTLIEFQVTRWPFVEVEACHECNCYLGAQPPWTLPERKAKVKEHLKRKYGKYLRMPNWTEHEISEMGRGIFDLINESQILKELIKKRLGW